MKSTATGLRVDEDAFVFGFQEFMRAMPAIGDEFMLRQVIQSTDHDIGLEPDQKLREAESCIDHSFSQREEHLIRIENIQRIFLTQKWFN